MPNKYILIISLSLREEKVFFEFENFITNNSDLYKTIAINEKI